jgi:hypothetical protein
MHLRSLLSPEELKRVNNEANDRLYQARRIATFHKTLREDESPNTNYENTSDDSMCSPQQERYLRSRESQIVHKIPTVESKLRNENNEVKLRLSVIEGGEFGQQISRDVFKESKIEESEP